MAIGTKSSLKTKLTRFIINVGTSGKYNRTKAFGMSDYLIRYWLLNFIIIFGICILSAFTFDTIKGERYASTVAVSVMNLACIITFILARTNVPQIVPFAILTVFYGLMCVTVTLTGGAQGANFLFIYMYPSFTIILMGMRLGIIFSTVLIALIYAEMSVPGLVPYKYHFDITIRMLVGYILVFGIMIVIETTRQRKDRQIAIQNKKLRQLREEAEAANHTKSNFLASMSHEIRTPMNAITGMAELLLRRDFPDDARSEIQSIKQAGLNLVSIINDILDFSKIEAGKLEIISGNYLLSSIINDTVNIIRMRLMEKPIRFYTNIDGNISNDLIGDEVRLRQILMNLLSNAVKYSEKGHISLSITVDKKTDKQIWLKVSVCDTGFGIKPEDLEKLFGDFVQIDTKKNRGIEGTGLGLAITKRLCKAMGGDITVTSEYGKGSEFTFVIPQGINSDVPFAKVNDPEQKKLLVYEGRAAYAKSVCWSLENMKVPHVMVTNLDDFTKVLPTEEWFYVFSGYGLYERIKAVMEKTVFPNNKQPPLALMIEFGTEAFIPNIRFVSLPVLSLSIANLLNGTAGNRNYSVNIGSSCATIHYTYSNTRLLIVDDIATNLKVAEGLLAPYKATIDTCLSGIQAIELVKKQKYDLIFMDHMMPKMDGIETTAAIRALDNEYFKTVPIVALTANAVAGMKEMFLEKGFTDFLAKPIDISKMDEMLNRWLPKEKREQTTENNMEQETTAEMPEIQGVNMQHGLAMTGGTISLYRQVLALFRKDAEDRLPMLRSEPAEEALPVFVTQVHAIKSASSSLGAADVSAMAAKLEAAGKAKDMAFIRENLSGFAENLAKLVEGIRVWESAIEKQPAANAEQGGTSAKPLLLELASALETQKADDIDRILEELMKLPLDAKTKEILEKVSDDVLMAEFAGANETVRNLINGTI